MNKKEALFKKKMTDKEYEKALEKALMRMDEILFEKDQEIIKLKQYSRGLSANLEDMIEHRDDILSDYRKLYIKTTNLSQRYMELKNKIKL